MEKLLEVLEAYIQGSVEQRAKARLKEAFKDTKLSVEVLLKNSHVGEQLTYSVQLKYEDILQEEKIKMLDQIMVKLGL